MKRILVLSSLLASGLASLAWSQTAAPAPAAVDPANFTGKVTSQATTDVRLLRYTFEPAARTNWHSHAPASR
jgi:quercetin dioxygenase-like cupin family protein